VLNVVCLNEVPEFYDVDRLPESFKWMGNFILTELSAPLRNITDTQAANNEIQLMPVKINFDYPALCIGSKINVPYLLQQEKIIQFGYPIIALVRDPIFVVASWIKHQEKINEYYVMPEDFEKWPRYKDIAFTSEDRVSRQAELWNYLASKVIDLTLSEGRSIVYKYEQLNDMKGVLTRICYLLEMPFGLTDLIPDIDILNEAARFPGIDFDEIRQAVKKYCPLREIFNYEL